MISNVKCDGTGKNEKRWSIGKKVLRFYQGYFMLRYQASYSRGRWFINQSIVANNQSFYFTVMRTRKQDLFVVDIRTNTVLRKSGLVSSAKKKCKLKTNSATWKKKACQRVHLGNGTWCVTIELGPDSNTIIISWSKRKLLNNLYWKLLIARFWLRILYIYRKCECPIVDSENLGNGHIPLVGDIPKVK